jgi:putative ABC transport system permease protein
MGMPNALRWCRACLTMASAIVPSALRADWRAEWEAELADRWARIDRGRAGARAALLRRCLSAFVHAAWLRKETFRMESLLQDARCAVRLARRDRAFTLVAVLTLALGIGANAALFTVLNGTLLQTLPFHDPDRLALAWETLPAQDIDRNTPAPATFADWRTRARTMRSFAAMTVAIKNLTGDGEPEQLLLVRASSDLMPTLGVTPALGRPIRPDEDHPGGARVILISDALWTSRYGRNPSIVGRSIRLDGEPATVIGVLPRDLPMPVAKIDGWVPLALGPTEVNSESRMLWVFGRLAPRSTPEAATAELSALVRERTHGTPAQIGARVESIDDVIRGDVRPDLVLAFCGTAIVLLIACGNVAMMLLTRGAGRQREFAIRAAVGASRARVVRQLTIESIVLAALAAAAGMLLAYWALDGLSSIMPDALRNQVVPRLDWRVLAFVTAVSLATVVLFGVFPAVFSLRRDSTAALATGARTTERGSVRTLRGVLVISEVALTVVLLSAAALLGRTFSALLRNDLGFSPDRVLTLQVPRSNASSAPPERRMSFYRALETRIGALPGVRAVGLTNGLPVRFTGGGSGFFPEGAGQDAAVSGNHRIVNGAYFAALGIPLLEGRTFADSDTRDRPAVALVSRAFADHLWPGRDAVGRRFTWGPPSPDNPWITVIGVVGDIRLARSLAPAPHAYFAFTQVPDYVPDDVAVRVDGDPLASAAAVRAAIREIDPEQPVANMSTYERLLSNSVGRRRFTLSLMTLFAALALGLAAVGLYGVIAFIVSARTRELGVRIALGAKARTVRIAVLRDGLLLASAGAIVGVVLASAIGRWASAWLPGVAQLDFLSIAAAVAAILVMAAVACDVPARRAAGVDPMKALRIE